MGRPIKWVTGSIKEPIYIGKPGVKFKVWDKWKKSGQSRLGTLTVSIGGLAWRPAKGKVRATKSWDAVAAWFDE
jgi:hypothetical protein